MVSWWCGEAGSACACPDPPNYNSGGLTMAPALRQFIHEEDGQDVVEYGLLIATIAIVVLIGVGIFGGAINTWFANLAGRITTTGT
jgi:pilus assembly protein Flp/PilA